MNESGAGVLYLSIELVVCNKGLEKDSPIRFLQLFKTGDTISVGQEREIE